LPLPFYEVRILQQLTPSQIGLGKMGTVAKAANKCSLIKLDKE
jgi:hypothetical protein